MFGPNLRALIALLRERARLSEEQAIEFLEALHGISTSQPTIEAELKRALDLSEAIKPV